MVDNISLQAGPSIWIIIVIVFYVIRMFTKVGKQKNKPNPTEFDSQGNDNRPGKSIEEILRELQGNFEERKPDIPEPNVITETYAPKVEEVQRKRPSTADSRRNVYKPIEGKVDLSKRIASARISKKAERALHSRRKAIDNNENLFDPSDNQLLEIEHIGGPRYNDISSDYTLDDLKQGVILQAILERPEF